MDVNGVASTSQTSMQGMASMYGGNLGKDAFLELLVTQLRHQDPLKPMENTEFIAQLSQFSSLEQLWNVNDTLSRNVDLTQSVHNALMTNLIGKHVKVASDTVQVQDGVPSELSYRMYFEGDVNVQVLDAQGNTVRTDRVGFQEAGEHAYAWDGKDADGKAVPEGDYYLRVTRIDPEGNESWISTYLTGEVTGLEFLAGSPVLYMGERMVNPSDIIAVYEPENTMVSGR